jgi:iron complex outermembrane recepter protein
MRSQFYANAAKIALLLPVLAFSNAAMAQSTGSIGFEEEEEIVVTGSRSDKGIEGIVLPDAPKARAVLTQEFIDTQVAGQSILNTINQIPGVNFTNNDAYGSSGGNIRIRGFDGARISLTFDGVPLNDSGNYAIFSNQQLDPEIIEQVNVNLGTTDVDSPTASAAGGTVNIRSLTPSNDFGAYLKGSVGEENFFRVIGVVQTGEFTSFGTKAWFSASSASNDKFKGPGSIDKQQYNAKLYQPIGSNGDFISIAGHYNQNRNNFYRNPSISDVALNGLTGGVAQIASTRNTVAGITTIVGDNITRITNPSTGYEFENLPTCTRDAPTAGVADNDNAGGGANANNLAFTTSCSNFFGLRINPSNTGNVRINSKFTLSDNLTLTIDPSYQYVLANGGGSTGQSESAAVLRGTSTTATGVDLNGDGDTLDTVRLYTPNNTNTNRFGVTASLIWDISDAHRVRVAYSYDRANHRQTGEFGFLQASGSPESPFSGRNARPVLAADGFQLQQRDRKSIALLNQVAGEYRGKFLEDSLIVNLGVRLPYFERELDQRCYTQTGGSGFATCTSQPASALTIVSPTAVAPFPSGSLFAPFKANYKFNKALPNVGFVYKPFDRGSIFGSFAQGLSSPRTDNLYRAPRVDVNPETTDSFDLGVRYASPVVQFQLAGWYQSFKNRIVSSFDQDLGLSIDRNIGNVKQKGVDVSVNVRPADFFNLYLFTSYIDSKIKSDVQLGRTLFVATSGKAIPETPEWQYGGRGGLKFGPVAASMQVKYVGKRFATDLNDVTVPSYVTADADVRVNLEDYGFKKTYFQLNVFNLFDKRYIGSINTQISNAANGGSNPSFVLGAPRTISGTLRVGF